ncbi:MAG TPA: haloacid dehalogenase-like hydrolase [Acidobacteriaceae bacterium]|nr:haloacid dehalogenase-like hydrolase [Acidobacteriaceae bacterium]
MSEFSSIADRATAAPFTAAEFHSAALDAVEGPGRSIAVFDCVGTLWSGDAGSGFMRWTIAKGLLSPEAIAWLDERYQAYLAGKNDELSICGQMVQVYRGLTEAVMRAAAAEFFATEIEHRIFPELRDLIAQMRSRGVEIWAVSSTNDWVIEEGVSRFNIAADRVLAARVAIENGIVTDRLLDVPTDEGKAASLARAGIAAPHAVFGNSIHDAAMLALARCACTPESDCHSAAFDPAQRGSNAKESAFGSGAFPVNPTPALLDLAAARRWPVYYPTSVAPVSGFAPEAVGGENIPAAGPSAGEPRG